MMEDWFLQENLSHYKKEILEFPAIPGCPKDIRQAEIVKM